MYLYDATARLKVFMSSYKQVAAFAAAGIGDRDLALAAVEKLTS